ncbi:LLM class flavin-dependent oxidoreductase, partial [Nocardia sp. NPDC049707]
GAPRLVTLMYFALGNGETGKRNIHDYYIASGQELTRQAVEAVCDSPAKVKEALSSFADIGATDIVFNTGTDDIDDVKRLADVLF